MLRIPAAPVILPPPTSTAQAGAATPDAFTSAHNADGTHRAFAVHDKGGSVFNVEAYRNGGTDRAAIQAAAAALQSAGGGTLLFDRGRAYAYDLGSNGATLCSFSSLNGVTVDLNGATIEDTRTYTNDGDQTYAFAFTGCTNIRVNLKGIAQNQHPSSGNNPSSLQKGTIWTYFQQGCSSITVDAYVTGGGFGVFFDRTFTDPDSYRSHHAQVRIRSVGCFKPFGCAHSGDHIQGMIDAEDCGRAYIVYGCRNHKMQIRVKNQSASSVIASYEGDGCSDLDLTYEDTESDIDGGGDAIRIRASNQTPTIHRNISIHVNLINHTGAPWGNGVVFEKYQDDESMFDTTGRGHTFENIEVSGYIEIPSTVAAAFITMGINGTFTSPDVVRNLSFEKLILEAAGGGSATATIDCAAHVGPIVWYKVRSNRHCYTINAEATYIDCRALNFTSSTGDTQAHTYIDCTLTSGANQSTTNKTWINCTGTPFTQNTNLRQLAVGVGTAIKQISMGTIAIDPGSIAATTKGKPTFTLTGAASGDRVIMEPPDGLHDDILFLGARVTAANTVTVYLYNPTGSAIDDGSLTWNYTWLDIT